MKKINIAIIALMASILLISCGVDETSSANKSTYIVKNLNKTNITAKANITTANVTANIASNATSKNQTSANQTQKAPAIPNNMTIYFLGNLEGSSSYLEAPNGKHALIDGGSSRDGSFLIRWLMKMPGWADNSIATNANYQNMQGINKVIYNFNMTYVYDSGFYKDYSAYKVFHDYATYIASGYKKVTDDMEMKIDPSIKFMILTPFENGSYLNRTEDNTLVIKATYNKFSVLFLGDCSLACQEAIKNKDLKAKVLKLNGDISQEMLKIINPEVVIANYASNTTSFGGAQLFTKKDGLLTLKTDGTTYQIFRPAINSTGNSTNNSTNSTKV